MSGLMALAAADPLEAAARARRMLEQGPSPTDRVTLLRTLGTALQFRNDTTRALAAFEEAVEVAQHLHDREPFVAAAISLAGALAAAGRGDEALATLEDVGDPAPLAGRLHFQRGLILARTGDSAGAVEALDLAESHLDEETDPAVLGRMYKNRGIVQLALARADEARRDLERARVLFDRLGDTYEVGMTEHNLGLAELASGSPAEALRRFDRGEPLIVNVTGAYTEPGRAEALLAAGLFDEARREAVNVAGKLTATERHREAAETYLLASEAALLGGHRAEALELASKSRSMFFAQGRPAWEARAIVVELAAAEPSLDADQLEAAIDELAASGQRVSMARVEAIAARVAARSGRGREASGHLEAARSAIEWAPLDLEVDLRSAEVEVRIANGDTAGAARVAAAGLRGLANRHRTVSATDARAGVMRHAHNLAKRGLELAIESGNPRRVWAWIEHERHIALEPHAPRIGELPDVAGLMAELRSISALIQHAEAADEAELVERQRQIEKTIARARANRRPIVAGSGLVDGALDTLGESALVQLASVGDDLWAVVARGQRVELLPFGNRSRWHDAAKVLGSTMRRALYAAHDDDRRQDFDGRRAELRDELRALLPHHDGPVIVLPTPELAAVPWATVLPAGGPVTLSPSTALWLGAQERVDDLGTVAVLAGPDLTHAGNEVTTVGLVHVVSNIAAAPTVAEAANILGHADTVHVAGPGRFRSHQPLFNSLAFADGDLFIHELASQPAVPTHIVLSVRETGFVQRTGGEMLETAASLMAAGTRSILTSSWPLPDTPAVTTAMVRIHRGLAAGRNPAAALRDALSQEPQSIVLHALSCIGA